MTTDRTLFLNMTMSLDGYIAGPNGELDWMTTAPDPELTADIVAQLRRADEGFIGYPTAEAMIRYWAGIAQDRDASPASRDIADAVAGMHTFAVSRKPERIGVPNAEVLVAPDDETLTAAVTAIKQRPGRELGLPGGVRTAQTFARLGLIDQYVFLVEPVALGAGQRLFTERTALTPIETKSYACGVTRHIYRPARSAVQVSPSRNSTSRPA
jgi:dihydrofolate reductase